MNIFKSIKWRLQIWYGLILVLVLAGFGLTAYQLERNQQIGRIDNELHHRVGVLVNALHHRLPHRPDFGFDGPPLDQPDRFRNHDLPGPPEDRPLPGFHLAPEDAHFFEAGDPHDYYFCITQISGHDQAVIGSSSNYPDHEITIPIPSREYVNNTPLPFPPVGSKPPPVENFGDYREIVEILPSGEMVQVGCSITLEQRELEITAMKLGAFGGVILLFGLSGGWWFVGRALRPIAEISAAATKISGSDLSERINVAEAESELGQLANVLNSTFARLETAFGQQQQFAADAAHELRTPVSVILTQTQTALNRDRDAAGYKQTLEACERAAQRMRRLIESLLELARLDAGQEVLDKLSFDLSRVVADAVELVKPLAQESGVNISTEIEPVEINGDSERLAQVVTNLLANAIQYNKPDGEVRVHLKSEKGLAILTVADSGKGISAADLPHVFERFYRADKSRTGAGHAGLGLAISRAIIAAHAGTIDVTSKENIGTTITVRLPALNG